MDLGDSDIIDELFDDGELLQDASQASLSDRDANLSQTEDASQSTSLEEEWMFDCMTDEADDFDDAADNDMSLSEPDSMLQPPPETENAIPLSPQPTRRGQKQYPNAHLIDKIEAVFEAMTDALLNEKNEITISLKSRITRKKSNAVSTEPTIVQSKQLCFPGKSEEEAWRFSMVIRILEIMHEALRNDIVLSKRDIYYRDPALFGSQSQVDRYVDDIAFTFGVSRTSLNVTAVAKGLYAGALTLHRRDGSTIAADSDPEGLLVPNLKDILAADLSAVKWVLVIEKEATFRSIAGSSFWKFVASGGLLLTAKGYPDLSSRSFLHFLSMPSLRNGFNSPPVFGLADFDPDGIAILSTYKYGSRALAHENADLAVPQLQWLGLRSKHLRIAEDDSQAAQGLLPMTTRDRKKANDILEQLQEVEDGCTWQHELQIMLLLNTKAELQLLDAIPDSMAKLLTAALIQV